MITITPLATSPVMRALALALSALVLSLVFPPAPAAAQRGSDAESFQDRSQRQPPRREREASPQEPKDKGAEAQPPKPIPSRIRPPGGSSVPEGGAQRAKLLDELFAHLATAADEEAASRVARAIEHVWMTTGSATVSLLLERARRAEGEKKPQLALRLLDRAAQIAPDYPEVFNRRAAVHFAGHNVQASVGDLRRVLALEPNHYKAMESLGQIFKDLGRKKAALEVYRRIVEIYPLMSGAKSTLDELEREVAGQDS